MVSTAAWLVPCLIIVIGAAIAGFYLIRRAQSFDILSNFRNRNPFARTMSFRPKPTDSLPSNAPPTAYVPPPYSVVVEKPPPPFEAAPGAGAQAEGGALPATTTTTTTTSTTPGTGGQPSPAIQRILNMK
ncbi:hypothetical protein DFQ26_007411 [Actinomortierella ambigua]|nr:hypothetical protein DFQ26_007411 [Actinomortierella ambigua]